MVSDDREGVSAAPAQEECTSEKDSCCIAMAALTALASVMSRFEMAEASISGSINGIKAHASPWRNEERLMLENLNMAHEAVTTTKSYIPWVCPGANEMNLNVCALGAAGAETISWECRTLHVAKSTKWMTPPLCNGVYVCMSYRSSFGVSYLSATTRNDESSLHAASSARDSRACVNKSQSC